MLDGKTKVNEGENSSDSGTQDFAHGVKLGVVTVFGILVPGMWFWISACAYFVSLVDDQKMVELARLPFPTDQPFALWLTGFVLVYVCGCVFRAIDPNGLDWLSICLVRWKRGNWLIPSGERYPYKSLPRFFEKMGVPGFERFVPWDPPPEKTEGSTALPAVTETRNAPPGEDKQKEGYTACSTVWVNTSKIWVTYKHPRMGDFLWREEAFIRSLSGVAWASILSSLLALLGITYVLFAGSSFSLFLFTITLVTNLGVLIGIVLNFHRQRLREVTKLVAAMYVLKHDDPPYRVRPSK